MSREGLEVSDMTAEQLARLNDKWLHWYNKLEHTIRWYARGDDDLTQIGIINLRKTLCEDINFPPNYLLHRAKLAIWGAVSYGVSVDSKKSDKVNQLSRGGGVEVVHIDGYENPLDNATLVAPLRYRPDILVIDKIAYQDFRKNLTGDEALLLDTMIETKNDGKAGRSGFRKEYVEKNGYTIDHYKRVNQSLRQKFDYHFGTENGYKTQKPGTPMYHGRGQ